MSKILIVDGGPLNRQMLVKLLNSHHHLALEASDGAEALQLARMERPDLIISDVLMLTMDGYEFVRQLRADPMIGKTPVIFITGNHLGREARHLAQSCGVSTILYRTCDQEEILMSVDTALEDAKHPEEALPLNREELDREHLQLLTDSLSEKSDQLSAVNQKLKALIECGQQLASERDPLKLMNEYCRAAREIVGTKWNALGVLDADSQTLRHFYTIGLDGEIAERLSPPSLVDSVFSKLLNDGRPFRIRLLDGDPQAEVWPSDFPPLSSCLSLPIIFQERVYGWLCLANKLGAEEFSDEDEQLAVTLVGQMAAAYENLTLYSEALNHADVLKQEIVERMRVEGALRDSEVRYHRLFEAARDGILILNAVTLKITDVNPFMTELLGYSRDEFLGKELWEIGFFDDKEASQATFRKLQETGYVRYADLPLKTKEGKPWDVEFVSNVYLGGDHKVIQCNIRDITARRLANESRDRLAAIVESSEDAIFSKTFDGVITSWNAGAERLYGYTAAEAIGRNISFIVPPECAGELTTLLHNLKCGARIKQLETVRLRKDGSRIDVSISISPVTDNEGLIYGASTIARDITSRKRSERALSESEAELKEAQRLAGLGSWHFEINSGKVRWSPETFRIYGRDPSLGPPSYCEQTKILTPKSLVELEVAMRKTTEQNIPWEIELEAIRPDQSRSWMLSRGEALRDADGSITAFRGTALDITERKQAEAAMQAKQEELLAMTQQFWQASKLATMGELTASIAHELNNPLAIISLRTESLLGQFANCDPKRNALKIIEEEMERMARLVSHLLQLSRRNNLQISTIDVSKELESSYDFIEHYLRIHQIEVVREFADTLPYLHADRQQLRQVFLNLLTNASDAMTEGGTLTLRVAAGQTEHGANVIVIEFTDTGTGIKPDDLSKVCEPFFTTKDEGKGTGLGLAICRRIVEEHKGTINIESEAGQGTTVRIMLPASESEEHGTRTV